VRDCQPTTNGVGREVYARDRACLEIRSFEQLERRFPNLDLGARPPDKPPSHDVGVQGANEDGHPPQRNSASDKPVAQLGQYLLRQRGRPSAVDQPLGNRSDLGIGHRAGIGSLLHRSSYYLG
jgi:hypothetical protein